MSGAPRVTLAPLRKEDSDVLFGWINDRALVILNAPFEPVERRDHDRWFEEIRGRDDVAIFGIRLLEDDRLIGSCQLNEIDRSAGTCQLQIRIGDRSAWDQGFGTEAVRLLRDHAFQELGLRRIGLQVFADNQRAIRAYEKAGFQRERVLPAHVLVEGEPKDVIEMVVVGD